MTLSRARDPFAGINHWKRKHIPAATQICQHPTAARVRARTGARTGTGTFTRGARMTEMIPVERERTRVNKREIMTRPRPTFRTHTATVVRTRTCTFTCSRAYGRQSPAVRHAGFSGGATESEGATRDARRISEEARETHRAGQRWRERERERERENGPEARCSSVDDSSLPWGARAAQPYSVHARVHADARVCGASRHQRGAIRSVCRVHWVTWKCVS